MARTPRILAPVFALLALLAAAAPIQDGGDPLADLDLKKERTAVRKLAETLAKSGRTFSVKAAREEFARLGASEKELAQLQEKTNKALLGAKPPRNARAAEKQLDKDRAAIAKAADALASRAAELDGEAQAALSRIAVRLDGGCAAARELLGHTQDADGVWRSERERALWTFRNEFATAISAARAREFELEALEPEDTLLVEVAQGPVSAWGYRDLRMEGEMSPEGLARCVQGVLRATAVSNWICTGELEPAIGGFSIVMTPSGGPWARYLDGAVAGGHLSPEERTASAAVTGTWQVPSRRGGSFAGWYVANTRESLVESVFKVDRSLLAGETSREAWDRLWKNSSPHAPYWVSAGLTNLVGLAVLDNTWNVIPFEEGSPADGSLVDAAGNELETSGHLMLLPLARDWMADEVAAGRTMPLTELIRSQPNALTSRRLLQLTFTVEFLAARDGLDAVLARYREAVGPEGPKGPTALMAALAPMLGQPVEDFEAEWAEWMLAGGAAPTVAGLLAAGSATAGDDDEASLWLDAVNAYRFLGAAPNAYLDPLLSAACAEYAEALDAGEEPSTPGALWAADHAVSAATALKPEEQLAQWYATVHLRAPLIRSTTTRVGVGVAGKAVVIDAVTGSYRSGLWHAHWPPHESREMPPGHADIGPDSVPGQSNGSLGYPVTLILGAGHGEADVEMSMTGPDGEVDCWYTSPLAPLNPDHVPAGVYALIPKEPLTGGRQYDVTARWGEAELQWSFITD